MLIEQIIQFELKGLDPLLEHVLLKPIIFITKQKSPKQIILEWLFSAKNIAGGNVPRFFHLGQVTYKI